MGRLSVLMPLNANPHCSNGVEELVCTNGCSFYAISADCAFALAPYFLVGMNGWTNFMPC